MFTWCMAVRLGLWRGNLAGSWTHGEVLIVLSEATLVGSPTTDF